MGMVVENNTLPTARHILIILSDKETLIFPEHFREYIFTNPEIKTKLTDENVEFISIGNEEYIKEFHDVKIGKKNLRIICLLSLEKQLAIFFSKIIHEFKNPLAAIRGMIQLALSEIEGEQDYPHNKTRMITFSHQIIKELDRMTSMLNSIMSMSKPKTRFRYKFDIVDAIKKALSTWVIECKIKGIKLKLITNTDKINFFGDRDEISQVVDNLVRNSIEALEDIENPVIEVEIKEINNTVTINVKDNGKGMDKNVIKKINNSFISTKRNGFGIGLFVVREIVTKNKGNFNIISNQNKGTTIQLIFPIPEII